MRGTGREAPTAAVWSEVDHAVPGERRRPRVVVWEADGSPYGGLGWGHAIVARLVAAGVRATTVPLTRRRPTPQELAAPVHVLSGGETSTSSRQPWVRSARDDLEGVLVRALAGQATVTGICFGAQLIATALAGLGAVGRNPRRVEAGLVLVRPPGADREPSDAAAAVVAELHYAHVEPAAVALLGGEVILTNDHTAVQAFRIGPTIVGLQFHPELDPAATRATVQAHGHLLQAHGLAPADVLASIDRLAHRWSSDPFDRFITRPALSAAEPLALV
jgi:GMP synthase-like glutamine amidotransferase